MNKLSPFIAILVLLLAVNMLSSCSNNTSDPNEIVITGSILNPTGDSVFIKLYPAIGWEQATYGSAIAEDGSFEIKLSINAPRPAQVSDGNEVSAMFLAPGDKLTINLDTDNFDESLTYSGQGASTNNYLASNFLRFMDPEPRYWILTDSLSKEEFASFYAERKAEQVKHMNEYAALNELSTEFIDYHLTDIDYKLGIIYYMYIQRKGDRKVFPDTAHVPQEFYDHLKFLLNNLPSSDQSMNYKQFLEFLPSVLGMMDPIETKGSRERDSLMMWRIQNQLEGKQKEYVLASQFYQKLSYYKLDFFEEYQTVFNEQVTIPEYKEYVMTKYQQTKADLSKELPENAILTDLNDEPNTKTSFADLIGQYEGQVLYLDFWASWCGPCRSEMPYSLELQEYFKDQDVAFVYISSDAGFEEWERMIKILQITGDHYRANRAVKKEYNQLFNVRYIPRYVLYDKKGNVIDSTAIRPSDNNIRKEIEKLL